MDYQSGNVSINAENIFPIIKKWLYSEKDIFIREVVSNANDAITKLKKLAAIGEAELPADEAWKIEVSVDKEAGTITVFDNGIGMTQEEVEKYINQVAFSGAKDFLEKYQGKADDAQIIGHFGLGFYSTFMVSDKVEIDTKSFVPGSPAVHWESESGMAFTMGASDLEERGTYITMHVSEDSKEYLEGYTLRNTLEKYFSFLPVPLFFVDVNEATQVAEPKEGEAPKAPEAPKPLNNPSPLWLKAPKDCTEEEYKAFYRDVFHDYTDPLFWIHLNIDYPFNLKGILYFPKLRNQYDSLEGTIKVYYNQVFVADNIKEILPEFLLLLKGVIDCPDLPLNVSRSFLQNDGYVRKISTHITKKVADKLCGLFNTEKDNYCKYWDDINPFVKYGCLKDEKFYEKVKEVLLFKTTAGEYLTLSELPDLGCIYYTDDSVQQAQYIKMLVEGDAKVVEMGGPIDNHYMSLLEYKDGGKMKFVRVDADIAENMKDKASQASQEDLAALAGLVTDDFRKMAKNDKLCVKAEAMKSGMPAILLLSEQARRMQEMMKMYGNMGMNIPMGEEDVTLVLNQSNPTVQRLSSLKEANPAVYDMTVAQIYDLALLAHEPMDAEGMSRFIERSVEILEKAAQ